MSAVPAYADVAEGDELPALTISVTRADLVRYAGASGDFNIIHWNERTAREVGLPDVIAHGMLSMAYAGRIVTAWVGDPGRVIEYGARFANPVVVPDDQTGTTLELTARVAKKLDDHCVRVDIDARCAGTKVLALARAVVRLN